MSIVTSIPYLVWLLISAAFFACGEYFSKKFGLSPNATYFAIVIMSYALAAALWLPAIMQKNQLSIVGAIWSVLSLVATVLIGTVLFGEHLNAYAVAGIVLGLVSVFLLSIA